MLLPCPAIRPFARPPSGTDRIPFDVTTAARDLALHLHQAGTKPSFQQGTIPLVGALFTPAYPRDKLDWVLA
jgi:hypothetical protein